MITSITQAAVATLLAAVKTDFGVQVVKSVNVNTAKLDDGSTNVNVSVGIPVTNTDPLASGQVSINYLIPA